MRILYTVLWTFALPFVLLRLFWRGRLEPGYRQHIAERFGVYKANTKPNQPVIWVHAVSVGETRAAEPLIRQLQTAYPTHRILLTHMTPTGRATGALLFPNTGHGENATPMQTSAMTALSPNLAENPLGSGNRPCKGGSFRRRSACTAKPLLHPASGREERNEPLRDFHVQEVQQCYLPYDIPFLVRRFLTQFKPVICILMETEVWPNLIYTCHRQGVPVTLVNARLSPKSFRHGERCPALIRPASAAITLVAAQTEADAKRIRQLGAKNVVVTGNSKFDVKLKPEQISAGHVLREQFGTRPILICASTREGEEKFILDAYRNYASSFLLLIVPRHPQRFDQVEQLILQHGFKMQRRTQLAQEKLPADVQVVLGDTMGELISYFVSSDVAFIGGSLLPLGGQNLIEACAVEKPVIIGPHTFNFEAISADAVEAACAVRVNNAVELMKEASNIIENDECRITIGKTALVFANRNRGATERTVALLREYIVSQTSGR